MAAATSLSSFRRSLAERVCPPEGALEVGLDAVEFEVEPDWPLGDPGPPLPFVDELQPATRPTLHSDAIATTIGVRTGIPPGYLTIDV
jgi:hypothetical protein